jgi:hypothetical protein
MEESTNTKNMQNNYSRAYYEVFIMSLIIVWLPFKFLAYLAPFVGMIWFIIRSRSGKGLLKAGAFIIVYTLVILGYIIFFKLVNQHFIVQNAVLSVLTYGSFIFLLVLPSGKHLIELDFRKYLKVIEWAIIFESSLGIAQAIACVGLYGGNFDSATGDVVQGTLNIMSFKDAQVNFNNQAFTLNMIFLLLFYVPFAFSSKRRLCISALGFAAVLFASVLHLFIAFVMAVAIISILFSGSFIKINTSRLIIILMIVIGIIVTALFQPKNFKLISTYYERVMDRTESPKTLATFKALNDLPQRYPWVYFIGLGPGQYSSRAGLIGTGKYFGDFKHPKELPFITPNYSEPFGDYVYHDWKEVILNVGRYGGSTMSRPFYSALSVIVEFGYLMFGFILILIGKFLIKLRREFKTQSAAKNTRAMLYVMSCGVAVLLLIFVSFFENYLEITQAIFIGVLMLKLFHSYLLKPELLKA